MNQMLFLKSKEMVAYDPTYFGEDLTVEEAYLYAKHAVDLLEPNTFNGEKVTCRIDQRISFNGFNFGSCFDGKRKYYILFGQLRTIDDAKDIGRFARPGKFLKFANEKGDAVSIEGNEELFPLFTKMNLDTKDDFLFQLLYTIKAKKVFAYGSKAYEDFVAEQRICHKKGKTLVKENPNCSHK